MVLNVHNNTNEVSLFIQGFLQAVFKVSYVQWHAQNFQGFKHVHALCMNEEGSIINPREGFPHFRVYCTSVDHYSSNDHFSRSLLQFSFSNAWLDKKASAHYPLNIDHAWLSYRIFSTWRTSSGQLVNQLDSVCAGNCLPFWTWLSSSLIAHHGYTHFPHTIKSIPSDVWLSYYWLLVIHCTRLLSTFLKWKQNTIRTSTLYCIQHLTMYGSTACTWLLNRNVITDLVTGIRLFYKHGHD